MKRYYPIYQFRPGFFATLANNILNVLRDRARGSKRLPFMVNSAVSTRTVGKKLFSRCADIGDSSPDATCLAAPVRSEVEVGDRGEIIPVSFHPFGAKVKRAIDLGVVALSAPLWLPVCGVICVAIWSEDRGHPVFKQARAGRGNQSFYTYKFRTMVPNAETVLKGELAKNQALQDEWNAHCKLRKDPRVTRVGKLLRKTSLDELPQLFNVLLGQMALVGPRPLPAYHLEKLPESVRVMRARVRPGLTGLWQVSGRSDAGNEGMIHWDPHYVRNWSIRLDLAILVRTVRTVLLGSGAR